MIAWDADRLQKWQDLAACAQTDPEMFFPEKGGTSAPAKAICRECPVRLQCLQFAMEREMNFGIFGGFSPRERQELLRATRGRVA